MKQLLLLFFFLFSFCVFSQEKGYTIYTKKGNVLFTKKYTALKDEISFKVNKKKQNISYIQLEKIVYTGKKEKHNLTKKYIYYSDRYGTLMEEMVQGTVSLYKRNEMVPTGAGTMGPTFSKSITYYVKKEGQKVAINIGINDLFKNYRKTSKNFFSDCPALVSKLINKEFKKSEIEEVVIFYNENCSN